MKSDTERKRYHAEKIHRKKSRLHVHLSKELRGKLKIRKRAVLVRKGDTVKVMRGPEKGKEGKVADVSVLRRKVFLEGISVKNARGREIPLPLEPSNLLLISLESTPERKEIFSEEAFRKKEAPKPKAEKPAEQKAEGQKAETKHEAHKTEHAKHETHGAKHETGHPKHETAAKEHAKPETSHPKHETHTKPETGHAHKPSEHPAKAEPHKPDNK
jgi:large subunit ribosomal protein L24